MRRLVLAPVDRLDAGTEDFGLEGAVRNRQR